MIDIKESLFDKIRSL